MAAQDLVVSLASVYSIILCYKLP